jgi:hypothetical protein
LSKLVTTYSLKVKRMKHNWKVHNEWVECELVWNQIKGSKKAEQSQQQLIVLEEPRLMLINIDHAGVGTYNIQSLSPTMCA